MCCFLIQLLLCSEAPILYIKVDIFFKCCDSSQEQIEACTFTSGVNFYFGEEDAKTL